MLDYVTIAPCGASPAKRFANSFIIPEAHIPPNLTIVSSVRTTCSPKNPKRQATDNSLSPQRHLASENNSSRFKRHIDVDECCVKSTFSYNGRVQIECRSEHPDCFAKTNAWSSSFGLCESIVNRENIVIGCRCAA